MSNKVVLLYFYVYSPVNKCILVFVSTPPRVNLGEVFQVLKVHRVHQELVVFRDIKVMLDYLAFLDEKDRQDHQDLRESKVLQETIN